MVLLTWSKFTFLVFALLLGVSHGAPTGTIEDSENSDECSTWKSFRDNMSCMMQYLVYAKDFVAITQFGSEDKQSFQKSCNAMLECYEAVECPNQEDLRNIQDNCATNLYFVSQGFLDCDEKLQNANTTCENGDGCEIFGEDNCLKDLMIGLCGRKEWVKYRNNALILMKNHEETKDCYFDKMDEL